MTREQRILRLNAFIVSVPFGIFFAAAAWPPLYEVWRIFFAVAHWPFNAAPAELDATGRLLVAIGGGLGAGLGAMTWAVATYVLPVAPTAGRRVIWVSVLTWFVTDSTFSVVAGSPMNALINVGLMAMLVLPTLNQPADEQFA
ncbi:MAG: hypothetical protein AAFP28_05055 [Pseudomonadota bacterium]